MAYYLNPTFYFFDNIRAYEVVLDLSTCIEKITPNKDLRDIILNELEV